MTVEGMLTYAIVYSISQPIFHSSGVLDELFS